MAAWAAAGRAGWIHTLSAGTAGAYWVAILALYYWDSGLFDRYILPFAMVTVTTTPGMRIAVDEVFLRSALTIGCVLIYAAFAAAAFDA